LNLKILHQNSAPSNPMGEAFNYAEEFKKLDLEALKKDLYALMTDSQDWWPADTVTTGGSSSAWPGTAPAPTAWATAAAAQGSGNQRFAPQQLAGQREPRQGAPPALADQAEVRQQDLLGRPDDPRRQLRLESMGFKTFGFAGGREDIWEPEEDIYWGAEEEWLAGRQASRYTGDRDLENPLAAVQMGLIYVNPEGPDGNPDPVASGRDVRETFARMAMNDEETVALIAGGHTFGKCHGAGDAANVGPEPEGRPHRGAGPRLEEQLRQRQGRRHHHQRHRGRLEAEPDPNGTWAIFEGAVQIRVGTGQEPGRRQSVAGQGRDEEDMVVDAHDPSKKHRPMMTTADLSLRFDPIYEPISRRFLENPDEFADAFARAWFKLTHRDMGPRSRYLGRRSRPKN
jgi:catalase-peroxidase